MNHRVLAIRAFLLRVCVAMVAGLIVPATAIAQQLAAAPPSPTLRKSPAAWMGYGILFVLVVAVMAVSLWPSKRGHQD